MMLDRETKDAIAAIDLLDCRAGSQDDRISAMIGLMGFICWRIENAMRDGGVGDPEDDLILNLIDRTVASVRTSVRAERVAAE